MTSAAFLLATAGVAVAADSPSAAKAGAPGPVIVAQKSGEGGKPAAAGRSGGGGGAAMAPRMQRSGGEVRAPRMREGAGRVRGADSAERAARRVDRGERVRSSIARDNRVERRSVRVDRRHDGDRSRPWRRGTRYAWGPGIYFYFYDGHYYGNCRWLRDKARQTGSTFWWRRYRQCRDG